jgi:hypothetical protein
MRDGWWDSVGGKVPLTGGGGGARGRGEANRPIGSCIAKRRRFDALTSKEEEEGDEEGNEGREETGEEVTEVNMGDCCVSMWDGGDEQPPVEGGRFDMAQHTRERQARQVMGRL